MEVIVQNKMTAF